MIHTSSENNFDSVEAEMIAFRRLRRPLPVAGNPDKPFEPHPFLPADLAQWGSGHAECFSAYETYPRLHDSHREVAEELRQLRGSFGACAPAELREALDAEGVTCYATEIESLVEEIEEEYENFEVEGVRKYAAAELHSGVPREIAEAYRTLQPFTTVESFRAVEAAYPRGGGRWSLPKGTMRNDEAAFTEIAEQCPIFARDLEYERDCDAWVTAGKVGPLPQW